MGCRPWVQIWPKFHHCNCCAVCTMVSYITAIYRESIVMGMVASCSMKSSKGRATIPSRHTHIALNSPRMVDTHWNIWYLGSKWNLHTVCWGGSAVSGAQPLFAVSLVGFVSLLLSPSTDIKIFNFCQNYHLKDTYKIFKKVYVGLKLEWCL